MNDLYDASYEETMRLYHANADASANAGRADTPDAEPSDGGVAPEPNDSQRELGDAELLSMVHAYNRVAAPAPNPNLANLGTNAPVPSTNEEAIRRAQAQSAEADSPLVAGLKGAAEGAVKGGAKAVKAAAQPFIGLATGAVRLAGTAQRAAGLGDELHRAANAADNAFANWGRDALDLGYDDALTRIGDAGAKVAGVAGSLGSLAVGGVAGKAIGALGKAGSVASKVSGAVGSNLVPAMFANDAAVATYDTAKENGQSTARALAEAGANATIHFIGFKLFENQSLNKMLGIPKEAANLIMPKSVMATARDVAPQTFAQLVGAVRKGALREIVAERAKSALRAGGIMGVQNFLSSIPTQLSEGDKVDFARALGEGAEGVKEGVLMEGLMGGAAALLTAKGARRAVKDAYLGVDVVRTGADGAQEIAHKPGLVDSATGRAFICSQRTEQVQEIFDAVASGRRVTAKMLNDAALPNDMKPEQIRALAEGCNYDAEASKVAIGIPNRGAGLFYEPSAADAAQADWERGERIAETRQRYAEKTADARADAAQHAEREAEILTADEAEVEADKKLNRDLDKIGGPDEVAKFKYDNAEEARLADILADQFGQQFGQFCYRNNMDAGDELAKLQFFRAVQRGEVDLQNAPLEPQVMPDENAAVVPSARRPTAEPQRQIGTGNAPQLGHDETQTPHGPIVTPQTAANAWKTAKNPGMAWGDIVRAGADAERARAEGRAAEAERLAGNYNRLLEGRIRANSEDFRRWADENGMQGVDLREAMRRYAEEMARGEDAKAGVRQIGMEPPRANPIADGLIRLRDASRRRKAGEAGAEEEARAAQDSLFDVFRKASEDGRRVTDAEIDAAVEAAAPEGMSAAAKAKAAEGLRRARDFFDGDGGGGPNGGAPSAEGRGRQPKPSEGTIYAGSEPGVASASMEEAGAPRTKQPTEKQLAARERGKRLFQERARAKKREEDRLKTRFVEEEQMNPHSLFSFAAANGGSLLPMPPRKHVYDKKTRRFKYVFVGDGPEVEALNTFFDGMKGSEYALWRDRIFGKGAKPREGVGADVVLDEIAAFQRGREFSGENGVAADEVYDSRHFQDYDQLLADFRAEYERYDEWKANGALSREEREMAEREAAEEALRKEEEADGNAYYLDELAAKERADAEYDNALGEIERWDGASATVQAFSPENLAKLKPVAPDMAWEPNDIVRFDHSDKSFGFVSFDRESGMLTLAPIGDHENLVKYLVTQDGVKEVKEAQDGRKDQNGTAENRNGDAQGERGGEGEEGGFALESATSEELRAEARRRREKAEIERRKNAPLKTGKGETGQTLLDLGGEEGGDLFNPVVRNSEAKDNGTPKKSSAAVRQNNAEPNRRTENGASEKTVTGAEAVAAQRALGNDATKSTDALRRQIPLWRKLGERGAKKADAAETLIAYREQLKEFDAMPTANGGESSGGKFHGSADDAYKRGAPVAGDGAKIENSQGYRDWLKANGKNDNSSMRRAYANEAVRKLTDLFGKAFRSMGFGEGDGKRKGLKFSFVEKIEGTGSGGDKVRYARNVTPDEDAAYMDAVKSGDMEYAQQMVNDRIRSIGGVFHRGKSPRNTQDIVEWADNPNEILSYGEHQYAHLKKHLKEIPQFVYDFAREYYSDASDDAIYDGVNPSRIVDSAGAWDDRGFVSALWERYSSELEEMMDNGIAGFKTADGAVSFPQGKNGNLFKSADPVTYDDAGNVIPLSQRFNPKNVDIRYARKGGVVISDRDYARLAAKINQIYAKYVGLNAEVVAPVGVGIDGKNFYVVDLMNDGDFTIRQRLPINKKNDKLISDVTRRFRDELDEAAKANSVNTKELRRELGFDNRNYLSVGDTTATDGVVDLGGALHRRARGVPDGEDVRGRDGRDAGKIPGIRNNRSSDQIPLRDSSSNIVGSFNRRTGEVKVLNGVDPNVAASALTHEIGHAARLHAERLAERGDRTLLDAMEKVVADAPESLKAQIAKEYGDLKPGAFADEVWAHFAEGKYSKAMLRAATEHKAWYARAWDAVKRAVVAFCEKAGIAKPSAEKICDRLFDSIGRGEDIARGEGAEPSGRPYVKDRSSGGPLHKWLNEYLDAQNGDVRKSTTGNASDAKIPDFIESAKGNNGFVGKVQEAVKSLSGEPFADGEVEKRGMETISVRRDGDKVVKFRKANNTADHESQKVEYHNELFPDTKYDIRGFAEDGNGEPVTVLEQRYVDLIPNSGKEAREQLLADFKRRFGDAEMRGNEIHAGGWIVDDLKDANIGIDRKTGKYAVVDCIIHRADEMPKSLQWEVDRKPGVADASSQNGDGEVRYRRRSPAPTVADIIDREEDWRERARHALQDKEIRIRNVQDEIGNVRDVVDRDGHTDWRRSTDVYEAIDRSHGYVEKENRKLQSDANSIYADMARDGITANQLNTYLLALHAKERNETIAQRNGAAYSADYAEGAGISENAANAFLSRIPAAKRAQLDAIERKVHGILMDDLKRRLDSGRITQEYHDLLARRWKHYVPLRTVDHATADAELGIMPTSTAGFGVNEHRTARGIGAGNAFVATGSGGNRLNVNPLAFSIEQAEEGIRGSAKNEIRNVAANLVEHSIAEGKGIGDIVQGVQSGGERNWGFTFSDGERVTVGGDMRLASNRSDIILFKRDGELCAIKLLPGAHGRGIELGKDLNGDNVARWHDSLQWIPRMTRWMSEWRTQNVPTFVWRNWLADHVEAYQVIVGRHGIADGSRIFANVVRNEFRNARDLRAYLRDPNAASGRVKEFVDAGGLTGGGTASEGYEERVSHIKDEYDRYVRDAKTWRERTFGTWKPEQTAHLLGSLRRMIEFGNEFAENSTRIGIFSALRDAGVSVGEAVKFARDATVNFNRKGSFMPWINGMFMFANAAVQGATRSAQAFTDSRGGRLVGLLVAAGVAKSLLDHYLGNDDEREREGGANARNKSEYEKKHSLGIPVGGGLQANVIRTRGPYASIPYVVQTLTDAMLGETDAKTALKRIAGELGDQATDLVGGGLSFEPGEFKSTALQTLAPSVADPLVQFATGRDYKGDLRVRRTMNENKPNSWNGKRSTAEPYKDVAKALNWLTGGGEFRKGGIDVAPEDVQLVAEFLWGGVGRDVSNVAGAAQTARRVAGGERPSQIAAEIPFVRDVVREYPNVESRYYKAADEVEADKYELRNLKGRERADFLRSHRHANGALNAMEREIKRLAHMENGEAVAKNGKVSAANFGARQREFAKRRKLELMARYLERLERMSGD